MYYNTVYYFLNPLCVWCVCVHEIRNLFGYFDDFELFIMAKNSDDALQIVEQILPFFQPDYTVTLNDNSTMGTTRDVPIVLTNVAYVFKISNSNTSFIFMHLFHFFISLYKVEVNYKPIINFFT